MNKRAVKSVSLALIVSAALGLVVSLWKHLPYVFDLGMCLTLILGVLMYKDD